MNGYDDPATTENPVSGDRAEALAILASIVRGEPRLTLSNKEAHEAADLVISWHRRGASNAQIASAITHALPAELRFPGRLVVARLRDRMPPLPVAPPPAHFTCIDCGDPLRRPGICRPCLFGEHSLRLEQDLALRGGPGKGQIAYLTARRTLKGAPIPITSPVGPGCLEPLPDKAAA